MYYNLDVIISVGYRVNSKRGIQFRQWASKRLKEFWVDGYSINNKRLKERDMELHHLNNEGSELYDKIVQLKFTASDGKKYATDCLETEDVFRLIQSIPSPKAEPFKLWLAQIASERLDEMQDPELSIDRALEQYLKLGYSENWINQRLKSIERTRI